MSDAYRVKIVGSGGSPLLDRVVGLDEAVELVCDHHDLHPQSLRATFEDLDTLNPAFEIELPPARGGGEVFVWRVTGAAEMA